MQLLEVEPVRFYLIRELRLYLGVSRATLYRALKSCSIKCYHGFTRFECKTSFVDSLDLWRLVKTPCFKKYYKWFSKSMPAIPKAEADELKRLIDLQNIDLDDNPALQYLLADNGGIMDITEEQLCMGVKTGVIPVVKSLVGWTVPTWFILNAKREEGHLWWEIYV